MATIFDAGTNGSFIKTEHNFSQKKTIQNESSSNFFGKHFNDRDKVRIQKLQCMSKTIPASRYTIPVEGQNHSFLNEQTKEAEFYGKHFLPKSTVSLRSDLNSEVKLIHCKKSEAQSEFKMRQDIIMKIIKMQSNKRQTNKAVLWNPTLIAQSCDDFPSRNS